MKCFEISKYTERMLADNNFLGEWSSSADIPTKVSRADYLETEDRYVRALRCLIGEQTLTVHKLENWDTEAPHLQSIGLAEVLGEPSPSDGDIIPSGRVERVIRRCLREAGWLELVAKPYFVLHFGYDFRAFVGIERDISAEINAIQRDGLHVHEMRRTLKTVAEWAKS